MWVLYELWGKLIGEDIEVYDLMGLMKVLSMVEEMLDNLLEFVMFFILF